MSWYISIGRVYCFPWDAELNCAGLLSGLGHVCVPFLHLLGRGVRGECFSGTARTFATNGHLWAVPSGMDGVQWVGRDETNGIRQNQAGPARDMVVVAPS